MILSVSGSHKRRTAIPAALHLEPMAAITRMIIGCAWWWLRSPGEFSSAATSINSLGVLLNTGPDVSDVTGMIRPALWVNLAG